MRYNEWLLSLYWRGSDEGSMMNRQNLGPQMTGQQCYNSSCRVL